MPRGMSGRGVGGGMPGGTKAPNSQLPPGVAAKDVQPHKVATKPNGMGRLAGGPRGHRELPRPIIPTPTQSGRRAS